MTQEELDKKRALNEQSFKLRIDEMELRRKQWEE